MNIGVIRIFVLLTGLLLTGVLRADQPILLIEDGWAREMPPGVPTMAVYLTIKNQADSAVIIEEVSSNVSDTAEIHEVKMDNDLMQMRQIETLTIPPGGEVILKPGSHHLMLIGLNQSLKRGDEIDIKLKLKQNSSQLISIPVKKDL